jgi:hypothetical protein
MDSSMDLSSDKSPKGLRRCLKPLTVGDISFQGRAETAVSD